MTVVMVIVCLEYIGVCLGLVLELGSGFRVRVNIRVITDPDVEVISHGLMRPLPYANPNTKT